VDMLNPTYSKAYPSKALTLASATACAYIERKRRATPLVLKRLCKGKEVLAAHELWDANYVVQFAGHPSRLQVEMNRSARTAQETFGRLIRSSGRRRGDGEAFTCLDKKLSEVQCRKTEQRMYPQGGREIQLV